MASDACFERGQLGVTCGSGEDDDIDRTDEEDGERAERNITKETVGDIDAIDVDDALDRVL